MKSYKRIRINGKQVRLHRFLMEAYIGRKLNPWELVHHNDGNIHNNDLDNLSITTRSKHLLGHEIGISTRFKDSINISKEDIEKLYCADKLPIHIVADNFNTTYGVILRRMVRYGIPRRKPGKIAS